MPTNILLAVNRTFFPTLFSPIDLARLDQLGHVIRDEEAPLHADKAYLLSRIAEAEVVITSWDTAPLCEEVIAAAPRLKLVCHAAGSIRPVVSDAFWKSGAKITSAASAIASGVAEYCLGLILSGSAHLPWLAQGTRQGYWAETKGAFGGAFDIYQQAIGVIGAGHIGRRLMTLLRAFTCQVFVYDPYLSAEEAATFGATKVETLEELFATCRVVSLNAPTNEGTRHMLRGHHFAALRPGSLFINSAGSIQIHEEEFLAELRQGRFVACIDRCEQEPCALDHPYRTLPNVMLTPHVAGGVLENRLRIGTMVADEIEAFLSGKPALHEVTLESLALQA